MGAINISVIKKIILFIEYDDKIISATLQITIKDVKLSHNKMHKLPSVSCVIATYNSSDSIAECLTSLFSQNYPKEKMEVIIVDGGSLDRTLGILKKFKVKLYKIPPERQEAEYNKGTGAARARKELVLFIDADNVLPHKNWLRKMVAPLVGDSSIIGSETLRFHYDKKDLILDRYFALLGGVDPVPYYLGKDSKLSWAFDKYNLLGEAEDKGNYYRVKLTGKRIPVIGANGFILRRKLLKYIKPGPENFFHTDINYDLIQKGFNIYSFVKDDIIHLKKTKISYFIKFLIRRKYIMETQYFERISKRRYAVFVPETDTRYLIKYIIYSLTFVKPVFDAVRGYIKVRDVAWFLHPVVCFSYLIVYSWAVLARIAKKAL